MPKLPIDPTNTVTGGKYYTYVPNYQLTAALESTKYVSQYPDYIVSQGLSTNTPVVMLGRGTTTTTTAGGSASVTMSPGTVANDTSGGCNLGRDCTWNTPSNATVSDGVYTSVIGDDSSFNAETYYLKATNFGFTIPTGATIKGILAEIQRYETWGGAKDVQIKIVKSTGAIGTTNKSNGVDWLPTVSYIPFGSQTDLWGETWTPSDINNSNFGIALTCLTNDTAVFVDHIRITVYYTP